MILPSVLQHLTLDRAARQAAAKARVMTVTCDQCGHAVKRQTAEPYLRDVMGQAWWLCPACWEEMDGLGWLWNKSSLDPTRKPAGRSGHV